MGQFATGNEILSLAEIDRAMREVVQLEQIFYSKPAIMKAFQASKNITGDSGRNGDYVTRSEFRMLLINVRRVSYSVVCSNQLS